MIQEDRMTLQDEELYRLGYSHAMAGLDRRYPYPAYLGGYRDGLADKAES
jgi:hypothetical protein